MMTKILFFNEWNIKESRFFKEAKEEVIYVWKFSIENQELLAFANRCLSEEESVKANQIKILKDQNAYRIGHGMLRFLLCNGDEKEARALQLEKGEHGKLYVASSSISFNISHAGEYVVIGFVKGYEIGVDLERIRKHKWSDAFLKKVLHEKEYEEYLAGESFGEKDFFLKWTQKEAVLKALGVGLTKEMSSFFIWEKGQGAIDIEKNFKHECRKYGVSQKNNQEDCSSWQMFSVFLEDDYFLSIAVI